MCSSSSLLDTSIGNAADTTPNRDLDRPVMKTSTHASSTCTSTHLRNAAPDTSRDKNDLRYCERAPPLQNSERPYTQILARMHPWCPPDGFITDPLEGFFALAVFAFIIPRTPPRSRRAGIRHETARPRRRASLVSWAGCHATYFCVEKLPPRRCLLLLAEDWACNKRDAGLCSGLGGWWSRPPAAQGRNPDPWERGYAEILPHSTCGSSLVKPLCDGQKKKLCLFALGP